MSYKRKAQESETVHLNPYHTHFLLIDDGSTNQFGKEIEWRSRFETIVVAKAEEERGH